MHQIWINNPKFLQGIRNIVLVGQRDLNIVQADFVAKMIEECKKGEED